MHTVCDYFHKLPFGGKIYTALHRYTAVGKALYASQNNYILTGQEKNRTVMLCGKDVCVSASVKLLSGKKR